MREHWTFEVGAQDPLSPRLRPCVGVGVSACKRVVSTGDRVRT